MIRPFTVHGLEEKQPPGPYIVETDEERIESLSFPVYRRTATWIHLPQRPDGPGFAQVAAIDPDELDGAVASSGVSNRATGAEP